MPASARAGPACRCLALPGKGKPRARVPWTKRSPVAGPRFGAGTSCPGRTLSFLCSPCLRLQPREPLGAQGSGPRPWDSHSRRKARHACRATSWGAFHSQPRPLEPPLRQSRLLPWRHEGSPQLGFGLCCLLSSVSKATQGAWGPGRAVGEAGTCSQAYKVTPYRSSDSPAPAGPGSGSPLLDTEKAGWRVLGAGAGAGGEAGAAVRGWGGVRGGR